MDLLNYSESRRILLDKLVYYRKQYSIVSGVSEKFELEQRIKETKSDIEEIDNEQKTINYNLHHTDIKIVGSRFLDTEYHFKNRTKDISIIEKILKSERVKYLLISGHNGIGKTALLSYICHLIEKNELQLFSSSSMNERIEGIIYFDCHNKDHIYEQIMLAFLEVLPYEAASEYLNYLHNATKSNEDKVRYLLKKLLESKYLLALDNLEDVTDKNFNINDPKLQNFLNLCMNCPSGLTILATSCVRINKIIGPLTHEYLLEEGLPENESIELLRELDPDGIYGMRDGNEDYLKIIVKKYNGIPRALELVLGLMQTNITNIEELAVNDGILQQEVLTSLFSEFYNGLTETHQFILRVLAIFDEPVNQDAIEYFIKKYFPDIDFYHSMNFLVNNYLVKFDRNQKIYSLHTIDQRYCNLKLQKESYSLIQNYQRTAAQYYETKKYKTHPIELQDIEDQLKAYRHYLLAGNNLDAGRIAVRWFRLLSRWGYLNILDPLINTTINSNHGIVLAKAYLGKSSILCVQNKWSEALKFNDKATQIFCNYQGAYSQKMYCFSMINSGYIYIRLFQLQKASTILSESLKVIKQLNNLSLEGRCLSLLALIAVTIGEYDEVFSIKDRISEISKMLPKQEFGSVNAHMHDIIGKVYMTQGLFTKASNEFMDAKNIRIGLNSRFGLGHSYNNLGLNDVFLGQFESGVERLNTSLLIRREMGNKLGEAETQRSLGIYYQKRKQYKKAATAYEKSVKIAKYLKENGWLELIRTQIDLGSLLFNKGQYSIAIDLFQQIYYLVSDNSLKYEQAKCAFYMSSCFYKIGNYQKATIYCSDAIKLSKQYNFSFLKESEILFSMIKGYSDGNEKS